VKQGLAHPLYATPGSAAEILDNITRLDCEWWAPPASSGRRGGGTSGGDRGRGGGGKKEAIAAADNVEKTTHEYTLISSSSAPRVVGVEMSAASGGLLPSTPGVWDLRLKCFARGSAHIWIQIVFREKKTQAVEFFLHKSCSAASYAYSRRVGGAPPASAQSAPPSTCDPPCFHGDCVEGKCVCPLSGAYWGPVCSNECPGRVQVGPARGEGCSGHGRCHSASGVCLCLQGYSGEDCSHVGKGSECVFNCSGHGVCGGSGDGGCACEDGWEGVGCERSVCQCSGHGACLHPGETVCFCEDGWGGETCGQSLRGAAAKRCLNDCNGRGFCDPILGLCRCLRAYDGEECSADEHVACPNHCSGHGRCSEHGLCYCMPDYEGTSCDVLVREGERTREQTAERYSLLKLERARLRVRHGEQTGGNPGKEGAQERKRAAEAASAAGAGTAAKAKGQGRTVGLPPTPSKSGHANSEMDGAEENAVREGELSEDETVGKDEGGGGVENVSAPVNATSATSHARARANGLLQDMVHKHSSREAIERGSPAVAAEKEDGVVKTQRGGVGGISRVSAEAKTQEEPKKRKRGGGGRRGAGESHFPIVQMVTWMLLFGLAAGMCFLCARPSRISSMRAPLAVAVLNSVQQSFSRAIFCPFSPKPPPPRPPTLSSPASLHPADVSLAYTPSSLPSRFSQCFSSVNRNGGRLVEPQRKAAHDEREREREREREKFIDNQ